MTAARPHLLSRQQRGAAGKALRATVSRESHADFTVDPARDPLPVLQASDALRVPSLVPERYKRMNVSPFAFYRGAAALMAHDFAALPKIGLPVQACGDSHLMNFGVFSSPEGRVLFDINDFDETCPGVDCVVDLKRLVASVAVAAQDAGLPDKKMRAHAELTAKAYRDFMSDLAERTPLEVWQTRMDFADQVEGLGDAALQTEVLETMLKAEAKGKASAEMPKLDGEGADLRFVDKPPFVVHALPDGEPVRRTFSDETFARYRETLLPERAMLLDRYRLADAAFKVVGVGSVGTFCAIGLMATADGEPLVLQLKQAGESAIAALADAGISPPSHAGRRVVDGQRAMQAAADIFLGWTQDDQGRLFYMRQLKNRRLGSIAEAVEGKALPAYAALCGRTLARAHARTGDAAMIAGYVGATTVLDEALGEFAMRYASQTVLDHAKLAASPLVAAPVGSPDKKAA